jgi:hypothetical protein
LFFEGSALTGDNLEDFMQVVTDELMRWLGKMKKLEEMKKIDLNSSALGGDTIYSSCW